MAALTRPTEATYSMHEKMSVNTSDREDHSFCGVMFPVECKALLPIDRLVITSISVRGRLGPLTVWVSNIPEEENTETVNENGVVKTTVESSQRRCTKIRKNIIAADKNHWSKIYSKNHPPSYSSYSKLDISHSPIIIKPGQVRGIYVHSTLPGDEAIVYDNYCGYDCSMEVPEDSFVMIRPGMAHVSETPFGHVPIWGWGGAWRHDRKFVGKLEYGVVYKLWNPREQHIFGNNFQKLVLTLFACQRRVESPMSRLPDECIFYILNMCKWDWVGDDAASMHHLLELKKAKGDQRKTEDKPDDYAGGVSDVEVEDMILYDENDLEEYSNWTFFMNQDFFSAIFAATLAMMLLKNMQDGSCFIPSFESFFTRDP